MRNALRILIVAVVFTVFGFEQSKAAEASAGSIYAAPVTDGVNLNREDESGLLPMRASDRVQAPVVELSDRATTPQAAVEAIPTPTAFHAGGVLLAIILLSRLVRKLRWAY